MNKKGIVAVALIVWCYSSSFAQYYDFELWTEISAQKKIYKKVEVSLTEEYRFDNNASHFNDWLSALGIEYKLNKHFKLGGGYRFGLTRDWEEGSIYSHRINADLKAKTKLKRFYFDYRFRYQSEYAQINSSATGRIPCQSIRNRFTISYNVPKIPLVPFVAYEFYYSLNNVVGNSIEANRYTGGLEYKFSKDISSCVYYRYQSKFGNDIKAKNKYILGFTIAYSL